MEPMTNLLNLPVFRDNSPIDGLIAIAIAIALFAILLSARRAIRQYHKRLAATPQTELIEVPLEVLSRTTLPFFFVLSIFVGLKTLSMGPGTARILGSTITIALFWQTGVWAVAAAQGLIERKRQRSLTTDRAVVGSLGVIAFIAQVLIWSMVALLTLDNIGIDVTALVAGLGIGGIAIALAVQNILGDLFASLSITFDRPFVVGDFLSVGEFLGSVEYIGIKSTRLRSLGGEQIIMPNADLLGSRVRNYGRMAERRVVFSIGVVYETSAELLERIPALIRETIEAQQDTRFDRCHFAKYGAASLDFETVYYVLSADYNRYMDIQQAINLRVFREFARLRIEFAYPTQKLYVTPLEGERQAA
jgi:small-conductance mechanosensitive channel